MPSRCGFAAPFFTRQPIVEFHSLTLESSGIVWRITPTHYAVACSVIGAVKAIVAGIRVIKTGMKFAFGLLQFG